MRYIGVSTSSHQIEGNTRNDWTLFEDEGKVPRVGDACNSWEYMEKDILLIKRVGANAYRFSIEWSRIEPEEGMFNINALDRYRRFIDKVISEGVEPFITLHHFTNPIWFIKKGGWLKGSNIKFFIRYVDFIRRFIDNVRFWITINEPNVYAYNGYVLGIWPPGEKSILKAIKVVRNMLRASLESYNIIKSGSGKSVVGMAHHVRVFRPLNGISKISTYLRGYMFNFLPIYSDVYGIIPPPAGFMESVGGKADFVGINYYTRDTVKFSLRNIFGEDVYIENVWRNSLNWEIYPRGIYEVLKRFNFGKVVFILENGVATDDNATRLKFLEEHFKWIKMAIKEGVKVGGYFYWSLLDNYEWAEGYSAKFGLFTRDRKLKQGINLMNIWRKYEQD